MLGEKPQPQARCLKAGFCIRVAALLSAAPRDGQAAAGVPPALCSYLCMGIKHARRQGGQEECGVLQQGG